MQIDDFLGLFKEVKSTGTNQWQALCPAHDDKVPSLSIRLDGEKILLHCHAECKTKDILRKVGCEDSDLFVHGQKRNGSFVETYDYCDEDGDLLFQVCRKSPKGFVQRQPDGGGWIYNLKGVRRVLYRLPELLNADPKEIVWIVEGEKDADRLMGLGLVATTNPGGAGKWKPEYNKPLQSRRIVILPDNDEPGRRHAEQVAEALNGMAASVKVLELPGLSVGGDVSDWLNLGHTEEDLLALSETPEEINEIGTEAPRSREDALGIARDAVAHWLELPDLDVVDLILATVIANAQRGDPVWLLLVGPPSSAKSELLRALGDSPQVYRLSSLTGKTLISGHKDAKGGLLFRIDDGTTLLLLDFGQVLSLHPNDKALVLQRLREVYDGYTKGDFGNKTECAEWKGKLGFLGGATPAIEKYTSVNAELGDRFLFYRVNVPDRRRQASEALAKAGLEETMREELSTAFRAVLDHTNDLQPAIITADAMDAIADFADLATRLRTPVSRDRYKQTISYIPMAEGPARFGKALLRIGQALAEVRGKNTLGNDELRLLAKLTLDAIPSRRRKILEALTTLGEGKTKEIGLEADIATSSAGIILEDLMYLGAVKRWTKSDSDTATFYWRLKPDIQSQWALATAIAQHQELPKQKQQRGLGSINREVPSLVIACEGGVR